METFGQRLLRLRLAYGLTQGEVAGTAVSFGYISRIENEDRPGRMPSLDVLIALADNLGVSPLYLLTGDEHATCPLCGGAPHGKEQ